MTAVRYGPIFFIFKKNNAFNSQNKTINQIQKLKENRKNRSEPTSERKK